jgi:hypothetical protein
MHGDDLLSPNAKPSREPMPAAPATRAQTAAQAAARTQNG